MIDLDSSYIGIKVLSIFLNSHPFSCQTDLAFSSLGSGPRMALYLSQTCSKFLEWVSGALGDLYSAALSIQLALPTKISLLATIVPGPGQRPLILIPLASSLFHWLACIYLFHIILSYSSITPVDFTGMVNVTFFSSQKMYPMTSFPLYSLSTKRAIFQGDHELGCMLCPVTFKCCLLNSFMSSLEDLCLVSWSKSPAPSELASSPVPFLFTFTISPVGLYHNTMDRNNILVILR